VFTVPIPVPFAPNPSALRAPIPNRVLVVDAEPLIRWSLCTALEAAGFDAVSAANGVEARRQATEWPPPRVAVVDLLGAEDAGELLAYVRQIYPDCRFVLTTTRSPLQHSGATDVNVVEKPFDLHSMIKLVKQLIDEPPGAAHKT
jgi:DNA-binding NtrC family response regulator